MRGDWRIAREPDEGTPLEELHAIDLAELLGAILAELKLRSLAGADLTVDGCIEIAMRGSGI